MNRLQGLLLCLFVLTLANPTAFAACESVSIGATLTVVADYSNNTGDFDSDAPDDLSDITTGVNLTLDNKFTDKVTTSLYLYNLTSLDDSDGATLGICYAYINIEDFITDRMTFTIGELFLGWEWRSTLGSGLVSKIDSSFKGCYFMLYAFPVGVQLNYAFTDETSVEVSYSKFIENSGVPGFTNSDDLDLYYVRLSKSLKGSSKMFATVLYWNDQKEVLPGNIWILNTGIDYYALNDSLNLYGEFAYEGGVAHSATDDIGAIAFNAGAEYTIPDIATAPYVGLNITYYSGDDIGMTTTVAFDRYGANMNQTLIAENDYYGSIANWAPGYFGIKLTGGMKEIADGKFCADFILGYYRATGDLTPITRGDGLGFEIDALLGYNYTEDVYFVLGIGYFSPDEDMAGPDPDGISRAVFSMTVQF